MAKRRLYKGKSILIRSEAKKLSINMLIKRKEAKYRVVTLIILFICVFNSIYSFVFGL